LPPKAAIREDTGRSKNWKTPFPAYANSNNDKNRSMPVILRFIYHSTKLVQLDKKGSILKKNFQRYIILATQSQNPKTSIAI
jgi:hypothetical protein